MRGPDTRSRSDQGATIPGVLIGASPSWPSWSLSQYEDAEGCLNQQVQENIRDHRYSWPCRIRDEGLRSRQHDKWSGQLTTELAYVVKLLHLIGEPGIFWGFFSMAGYLNEAIVTDKYLAQDNPEICPGKPFIF